MNLGAITLLDCGVIPAGFFPETTLWLRSGRVTSGLYLSLRRRHFLTRYSTGWTFAIGPVFASWTYHL